MSKADPKQKFNALRAKYLAAKEKRDAHDSAMRARYGGDYQDSWLRAGDRSDEERLRSRVWKAGDALLDYVLAISPRDWSYGVPVIWVYEYLAWEDVVRPLGEPLSVTPPLSYGSTVPMR